VLLSACNTAAADGRLGAEGLSGLARAFFYAGARSLLVSHWSVDSAATVKLIKGALSTINDDPLSSGHGEAFRGAMLEMIDEAGAADNALNAPIPRSGRPSLLWGREPLEAQRLKAVRVSLIAACLRPSGRWWLSYPIDMTDPRRANRGIDTEKRNESSRGNRR
jgi:hypothetical protein